MGKAVEERGHSGNMRMENLLKFYLKNHMETYYVILFG